MKSTKAKPDRTPRAMHKPADPPREGPRANLILFDGVVIRVPKTIGRPRYHTAEQIRSMFREYYSAKKA
jgi:hypothetical protein